MTFLDIRLVNSRLHQHECSEQKDLSGQTNANISGTNGKAQIQCSAVSDIAMCDTVIVHIHQYTNDLMQHISVVTHG